MIDILSSIRNDITLVGLSGYAGSGKDYIATNYFRDRYGFFNVSLAWHLKVECVAKGKATYDEVFNTKPPRVRKLMQIMGTEQGRNVWGEDIWVNTTFSWIKIFNEDWGINKFVIPDVRFPNELDAIHSVGGKVYRIISDRDSDLTEKAKQHASEKSLTDDMNIYDGKILNTSVVSLDEQLTQIMEDINVTKVAAVVNG